GDLSDPDVPARFVETAVSELGGLDGVISNAGVATPSTLINLDLQGWERIFAINTRAPWLLAAAAYPWLKKEKGAFVAVSSMSGVQPYSGMGAYSPSKAALIMLIRQMAQEWSGEGIRANCISPGLVRTPLSQPLYDDPEIKSAREALVPVHRIAEADADIAGIVVFLLSDDARYITGQNILADGGLLDSIQTHLAGRPKTGN
ncbi:MAG: SDR family oxidoreductase, partial [Desulfatirhabdiaceae bacterium]